MSSDSVQSVELLNVSIDPDTKLTLFATPQPARKTKTGVVQRFGSYIWRMFRGETDVNYTPLDEETDVFREEKVGVPIPTRYIREVGIQVREYSFTTEAPCEEMINNLLIDYSRSYGVTYDDDNVFLVDWVLIWASMCFLSEEMFGPTSQNMMEETFKFRQEFEIFIDNHYDTVVDTDIVNTFVKSLNGSSVITALENANRPFTIPKSWAILARSDSRMARTATAYYKLFNYDNERSVPYIKVPPLIVAAALHKINPNNSMIADLKKYIVPQNPVLSFGHEWYLFGTEMMIPDFVKLSSE